MSAATPPPGHYGPGAYNSEALPSMPMPVKKTGRGINGLLKQPLSWGSYARLEPPCEMESQVEDMHADSENRTQVDHIADAPYINAVNWRFERGITLSYRLGITKLMSFPFAWFALGLNTLLFIEPRDTTTLQVVTIGFLTVGTAFGTMFLLGKKQQYIAERSLLAGVALTAASTVWREWGWWGYWSEQYVMWTGVGFAFMALIGCDALLMLHARFYRWDGSQFNRQTGMVTISASWWHLKLHAPFYEFDFQLEVQVMPYGIRDYVLWMEHRYTGRTFCLANRIHSLGIDRAEALATWDSLQRYMDISQPLPDQPILESTRHLDPTTAAYDLATNRPPRYWRDMKNKALNRTAGNDLRDKIAAYPWQQQPCLIKAHTDLQLSVADYYARQESHGIQTRSGGRPILEIHG